MKKKITIDITMIYGSNFQKESMNKTLELLLNGWTLFYNSAHKKNKVGYLIYKS